MTTTPERAGREGDSQPLPTASTTPHMHDLVTEDIAAERSPGDPLMPLIASDLAARKEIGIKRYGQPLQAFNGRDALRDAYEETLDLLVYLRQALWEASTTDPMTASTAALEEAYKYAIATVQILRAVVYVR